MKPLDSTTLTLSLSTRETGAIFGQQRAEWSLFLSDAFLWNFTLAVFLARIGVVALDALLAPVMQAVIQVRLYWQAGLCFWKEVAMNLLFNPLIYGIISLPRRM